ncbi:MAG TPA: hypothetical protein VG844_09435 [Terracidiphilus sp.]|nr:hypothetical protein [Terracidiphilus sp.]
MRRTILLGLSLLLALSAGMDVYAQIRTAARHSSGQGHHSLGRGNIVFHSRARAGSPRGFGYAFLPYAYGDGYDYAPQMNYATAPPYAPPYLDRPSQLIYEPPAPSAPRAVEQPAKPEFKKYEWPAKEMTPSTSSDSEYQNFALVLKDGSTLPALSVFASHDGLHYVDPDQRHMRISMSAIDRAATLKLNRARNLHLYLPAAE